MNLLVCLIVSALYVAATVFIWFSYPESWRRNRVFIAVMILWHVFGLLSVVIVFTMYKFIPHEGVKHELARIGTMYYIMTTIQTILFFIRYISSRTYHFVMERTGKEIRPQGMRRKSDKRIHSVLFILISFIIFTVGYFNTDILHDTRYEVSVQSKTEEKDLNICLISDIHAGSGTWEYTYDDLVKLIDASEPDALMIAGDAFDETTCEKDVEHFSWALQRIKQPKYGVYYIYGNHDSKIDDWAARVMRSMGVTVLEDEMTVIGKDIQLIGCMDPKYGAKDLDDLFRDCRPDPDKPIIVLSHRPKHFQQMADLGADLVMSGHTHGFNIPQFLGSPMLEDMYSGIGEYGDMTAITTSGVSAWGFHYKWPAVSEVVSIHVDFQTES